MTRRSGIAVQRRGFPFKQGPRDWLCQAAGAAAPLTGSAVRKATGVGDHLESLFIMKYTIGSTSGKATTMAASARST